MLFLLKMVLTLLALAATGVLIPTIPLQFLGLLLRAVGWATQKRTRSRREYVISRVRADEEEFQSKRAVRSDDDDWEKVENGSSSSSSIDGVPSGHGSSGGSKNKWDGIVGFFHPFWYVRICAFSPPFPLFLTDAFLTATQAGEGNVYFGKRYSRLRNAGPEPFVPYTRAIQI